MPPLERDEQAACLEAAMYHPDVAWVMRMNTGAMVLTGPNRKRMFFRAGFKGLADLLGQMKDGRLFVFEVKRQGASLTDDQLTFLRTVEQHGGVAGWGRVPELLALLRLKGSEL